MFGIDELDQLVKKHGSKVMITLLILTILKIVVYYSVGRTHGGKFQLMFPDLKEWGIIILAGVVLSAIGVYFIKNILKSEISSLDSDVGAALATNASMAF